MHRFALFLLFSLSAHAHLSGPTPSPRPELWHRLVPPPFPELASLRHCAETGLVDFILRRLQWAANRGSPARVNLPEFPLPGGLAALFDPGEVIDGRVTPRALWQKLKARLADGSPVPARPWVGPGARLIDLFTPPELIRLFEQATPIALSDIDTEALRKVVPEPGARQAWHEDWEAFRHAAPRDIEARGRLLCAKFPFALRELWSSNSLPASASRLNILAPLCFRDHLEERDPYPKKDPFGSFGGKGDAFKDPGGGKERGGLGGLPPGKLLFDKSKMRAFTEGAFAGSVCAGISLAQPAPGTPLHRWFASLRERAHGDAANEEESAMLRLALVDPGHAGSSFVSALNNYYRENLAARFPAATPADRYWTVLGAVADASSDRAAFARQFPIAELPPDGRALNAALGDHAHRLSATDRTAIFADSLIVYRNGSDLWAAHERLADRFARAGVDTTAAAVSPILIPPGLREEDSRSMIALQRARRSYGLDSQQELYRALHADIAATLSRLEAAGVTHLPVGCEGQGVSSRAWMADVWGGEKSAAWCPLRMVRLQNAADLWPPPELWRIASALPTEARLRELLRVPPEVPSTRVAQISELLIRGHVAGSDSPWEPARLRALVGALPRATLDALDDDIPYFLGTELGERLRLLHLVTSRAPAEKWDDVNVTRLRRLLDPESFPDVDRWLRARLAADPRLRMLQDLLGSSSPTLEAALFLSRHTRENNIIYGPGLVPVLSRLDRAGLRALVERLGAEARRPGSAVRAQIAREVQSAATGLLGDTFPEGGSRLVFTEAQLARNAYENQHRQHAAAINNLVAQIAIPQLINQASAQTFLNRLGVTSRPPPAHRVVRDERSFQVALRAHASGQWLEIMGGEIAADRNNRAIAIALAHATRSGTNWLLPLRTPSGQTVVLNLGGDAGTMWQTLLLVEGGLAPNLLWHQLSVAPALPAAGAAIRLRLQPAPPGGRPRLVREDPPAS